jgi:hypothetical protein
MKSYKDTVKKEGKKNNTIRDCLTTFSAFLRAYRTAVIIIAIFYHNRRRHHRYDFVTSHTRTMRPRTRPVERRSFYTITVDKSRFVYIYLNTHRVLTGNEC